jgi:hypothetical protein
MTSPVLATVSFAPVPDDYAALYAMSLTRSNRHHRGWARFILCVACWSAAAVSLLTADALNVTSAITAAVCSLIFILVFTARMWPDPEKTARQTHDPARHPQSFRLRTVKLEEAGVRHTTELSDQWFSWQGIHRAIITDQHLFLVVGNSMTLFVPARVFDGRDAFLAFAKIAQERYLPKEGDSIVRGFAVVMKEPSVGKTN